MASEKMREEDPLSVVNTEVDLSTVKVVLTLPAMKVKGLFKLTPSNADVKVECKGREVKVVAEIEEKNIVYRFHRIDLPGDIASWEVKYGKGGKLTLILTKVEEQSWVASLETGLGVPA
ncbi:uncharacterized protein LOC115224394 [Argonauta hians]